LNRQDAKIAKRKNPFKVSSFLSLPVLLWRRWRLGGSLLCFQQSRILIKFAQQDVLKPILFLFGARIGRGDFSF
jgi:hypothetical protein